MQQFSRLVESGSNLAPGEHEIYEKEWNDLAKEVGSHLNEDPSSSVGQEMAKKWMTLVNRVYTKGFRALGRAIWEKGYKTGLFKDPRFSDELISWIVQAVDHWYGARMIVFINDLKNATLEQKSLLKTQWNDFMDELYGMDEAPKV